MRIELMITTPSSLAARSGAAAVRAVATCTQIGFEMTLEGAAWIASYIEVLQALDAPASTTEREAARHLLAQLEDIAAGNLGVEQAALPAHLVFDVGDWDEPDAILGAAKSAAARKLPHC